MIAPPRRHAPFRCGTCGRLRTVRVSDRVPRVTMAWCWGCQKVTALEAVRDGKGE